MVLFAILLSFGSEVFLSKRNIMNVLRQVCVSTIFSIGFTVLLASGHIDLSVGSTAGLSSMICGFLMVYQGWPFWLAIIVTVMVGVLCGLVNSSIISLFKLPPFLVTMATQQLYRGFTYLITDSKPITNLPEAFLFIGNGNILGIPFPVYVTLVLLVVIYIVVNHTREGRYVLAIGGNPEAAHVSGINVKAVRHLAYGIAGGCAALAGIVAAARVASSQPSTGIGMEMEAIAAVVIGGTSMKGGNARVISSIYGCILVGMLANALNLMGVSSNWQVVFKGVMILFAITLDSVSSSVANGKKAKRTVKDPPSSARSSA